MAEGVGEIGDGRECGYMRRQVIDPSLRVGAVRK